MCYMIHLLIVIILIPLVFCFCIINHHYKIRHVTLFQYLQVGDPLEKAALKGIDWSYKADEKALPRR